MKEDELLDIVDEKDNVICQDTKENKFKKELISRNVAIFIIDNNKLLIGKRSASKRSFPNRYDLATCGNVKAGENYPEAAKRELKEELNITCDLKFCGKLFNRFREKNLMIKYFTGIFLGNYSGGIKLNDELVEIKRLTINEVERLINKNKDMFTPGFINDFNFLKDRLELFL